MPGSVNAQVRRQWSAVRTFSSGLAAGLFATGAAAAQAPDRNYDGLVAGLAVSRMALALDDGDPSGKMAGQFDIGYRATQLCVVNLPVLCWQRYGAFRPLRLTMHVSLLATDLRGMDPERDRYAYAHLDVGLRFTYALKNATRPYVAARSGSRQAETLGDPNEVWNRSGSGSSVGIGVELPRTPAGPWPRHRHNAKHGTFYGIRVHEDGDAVGSQGPRSHDSCRLDGPVLGSIAAMAMRRSRNRAVRARSARHKGPVYLTAKQFRALQKANLAERIAAGRRVIPFEHLIGRERNAPIFT